MPSSIMRVFPDGSDHLAMKYLPILLQSHAKSHLVGVTSLQVRVWVGWCFAVRVVCVGWVPASP